MLKAVLELPTMVEAEGGVRVIIKREIFYGIQQGGRIDSKTDRLIKVGVTKIITDNVTETTSSLAQKIGVTRRTIARDMDVLREKGYVVRIGPDNGGWWKRLK